MLTQEEAAARLAAAPAGSVCLLAIREGDYGCEEHRGPLLLWLLWQRQDGARVSRELPEAKINALGLREGGVYLESDLQ